MSSVASRLSCLALLLTAAGYTLAQQQPLGEVYASDATVQGSVQLTSGGTKVMSGANVTAGEAAARLRLARGGNVRVCPQTQVTVTASSSGRELMLAMGTGAIEADYALQTSADTIVTPDFRIMLAGPGAFHFALRSRPNGDTCVQTRASNSSSIVVSELMGDATYQVKPNEMVLFRKGRVANPDLNLPEDCGCPPPAPIQTVTAPKPAPPETPKPVLVAAQPEEIAPKPKVEEPPPPPDPSKAQVEVEAPFVFRAEDVVPPPPGTARLTLASLPQLPPAEAQPPAPAPETKTAAANPEAPKPEKKRKKGFFSRIGSFFANVFK